MSFSATYLDFNLIGDTEVGAFNAKNGATFIDAKTGYTEVDANVQSHLYLVSTGLPTIP